MRLNFEDDDRIASASGTVLTLPAKTQLGAGLEACRQLEVESLPTPQVDMLRSQSRGILEADIQSVGDVRSAGAIRPVPAGSTRGVPAAEQVAEDAGEVGLVSAEFEGCRAAIGARAEAAAPGERTGAIEIGKAEGSLRIAVLVDLAAIVAPSFVLVGEQVVGRGHGSEAFRRARLIRVTVGMILLGELAICLLDRGIVGIARDVQGLVWIGHSIQSLSRPLIACDRPALQMRWQIVPSESSVRPEPPRLPSELDRPTIVWRAQRPSHSVRA